jgi:hypothetical protein
VHEWLDGGAHDGLYSILDIGAELCDDKLCLATYKGNSLYSDDNHLSAFGAQYVSFLFQPFLSQRESLELPVRKSVN